MRNVQTPPACRVLCLAVFGVAGLVTLTLLHHAMRRPPETVGFAEFKPPVPAGHPVGLTVRLNLPVDFRARYPREHRNVEAGVENTGGDRVFYAIVRLTPATRRDESDSLLQAFARQNSLAGDADCLDVSAEFRTTVRGPIWCQRYTQVFQKGDPSQPAQAPDPNGQMDRLEVLRFAEEWQGLVLELEIHIRPGCRSELEPLLCEAVRGMELTQRRADR